MNVNVSSAIRHIDHVTYVAAPNEEENFLQQWKLFGFEEMQRVVTSRFQATHIAMTRGRTEGFPWEIMTGLSVSEVPESPINHFVSRYGSGIQHVAYNIDPNVEMELLQEVMTKQGWSFMTPILTYHDSHRACLKQIFTKPRQPYGEFVEFVQRSLGEHGEPYEKFDAENIDDLYEAYADYSHWLEKKK